MLAGPVFQVELLTTARRARYYALRGLYLMVLLFVLFSTYESFFLNQIRGTNGEISVQLMNFFGRQLFVTFSVAQGITVLLLTPALVAGTIAIEKQRKTLLYLLASDLSSIDIVLGKLAARMLHLFVFIMLGLPIFSLLQFFGGLELWMIAAVYAATFSAAIFIAGISIYASTIARRGRDAIIMAYLFVVAYFILPFPIVGLLAYYLPEVTETLAPIFPWLYPGLGASIVALDGRGPGLASAVPMQLLEFCWSLALLVIYGLGFVALSAWRLRPIAAKGEGKQRQRIGLDNRGKMTVRVLPKPPVPDFDPMLWKECYTSRVGGWAKLGLNLAQIIVLTAIGCFALDSIWQSFEEMFRSGFFPGDYDRNRHEFNLYIRGVSSLIFFFWVLGTAFSAASTVSGEREEDTWLSLIASVLTGREILRAKRLGAILRYRGMGIVLLILWALGLVTGSVHPLGILATAGFLASALLFTSSLGTYVSLGSKSTMRALGVTLAPLILLNGGFMLCCLTPFSPNRSTDWATSAIPFHLAYMAPLGYQDIKWLFSEQGPGLINTYYYNGNNVWNDGPLWQQSLRWAAVFYCLEIVFYLVAAFFLRMAAARRFPIAAERPIRPGLEPEIEEQPIRRPKVVPSTP